MGILLSTSVAAVMLTAHDATAQQPASRTLVTVVAAAYIISRGLAKAGSGYSGSDDPFNRDSR